MELSLLRRHLLILWSLLALSATLASGKKKKKLEIVVEEKPEDCVDAEIAKVGDLVTVHYTGLFENGQVFDSSRQPGREPFQIRLGAGQVIKGWEEGLQGMCVGEVRKLVIPPHLAYGDQGVPGAIPAGATLIFSVELVDVEKPSVIPSGRTFWIYVGVFGLVLLGGYELYRRATQQGEEIKKQKKSREVSGSKKAKKKK